MTLPADPIRDIALALAYNVRHLGGYTTQDGRTTSARFIRSGALDRLTGAGINRLRELGVRTVVDFRAPEETALQPTPDLARSGIRNIWAPVFRDELSPARYEGEWFSTAVAYERMLAVGMPAFRTLFETMAETDGAVLFHCTAGKDRTGVATALVLDIVGVDRGQIAGDYSRSAELLRDEFPRWEVDFRERGFTADQITQMLSSNAEDMDTTLDYIAGRWGSSEGYLREAGLSQATLSAVRARTCA